ncbi:contact-dependent growth inhibition system immunity protein [Streptomyces sp. OZ13]|uniref:contact-dependent growth inhibition system immunity protein n=1 Tax=Streptomyces sp. OZ13 TaxID=3452210 RepID=UPI003F8C73E7
MSLKPREHDRKYGELDHVVRAYLGHRADTGQAPPPATPQTRWEWHARFPELAQFLGGWFSQDMPDEFEDHDAAVQDYLDTTDSGLVAQLTGEVHDLLTLPLDETDYALAVTELGMEVDPPAPYTLGAWLVVLAGQLRST